MRASFGLGPFRVYSSGRPSTFGTVVALLFIFAFVVAGIISLF